MKKTSPLFKLPGFLLLVLFCLIALPANAQSILPSVSGKVADENGQALPGATVAVKGTSKGTVTNSNGMFTLKDVTANATITVSFQGYENSAMEVRGQSYLAISLKPDISK